MPPYSLSAKVCAAYQWKGVTGDRAAALTCHC